MDDFLLNVPLPLISLLILLIIVHATKSARKLPPSPSRLPIIGHLLHVGHLPHRSLQQLSQKFGDLMYLQLGWVPAYVISSPELAEEVLKTYDIDFCSRPQTVAYKKLNYNSLDVAFSIYGDNWRRMRKICNMELFSNGRVQSSRAIREEEVEKSIKEISEVFTAHDLVTSVDLTDKVTSLAQVISCRLAFGRNWHRRDALSRNKLLAPLRVAQTMKAGIFVADYFPWAGWIDVVRGWKQKLEQSFIGINNYFDDAIDEHLQFHADKVPDHDEEDFLDVLLKMVKNSSLTRDHIKGVLMNIFVAGIETNSGTIIWAMSELMRNRQAMKKAQEEIRKVAGSKGKVEDSDLKELHYLNAVVKETLRLHPPGPLLIPREAIRGSSINGYEIPPKARILVNVFSIGRDSRYWHNPLEFYPERFMNGHDIDFRGSHYQFLPFGAGRRICPGMELGIAIVELTLANLLYSFDWDVPFGTKEEGIDMSEGDGITVCKRTPLIVVPKPFHHCLAN